MAAQYDFRRKPSVDGDVKNQPLYPRIVSSGTIDFDRLVNEISEASTFTPGDIKGLMVAMEEKVSTYLVNGYHVQLGNMGYFSARLTARPVMNPKEIHAQSIFFDGVNLRPSSWFKKHVRGFLEKAKYGFSHSANLPLEEKRRRMEKYLAEHPLMTRKDSSALTGLLKNKALTDLNRLVVEGVLDYVGRSCHMVYIRPSKRPE